MNSYPTYSNLSTPFAAVSKLSRVIEFYSEKRKEAMIIH